MDFASVISKSSFKSLVCIFSCFGLIDSGFLSFSVEFAQANETKNQ